MTGVTTVAMVLHFFFMMTLRDLFSLSSFSIFVLKMVLYDKFRFTPPQQKYTGNVKKGGTVEIWQFCAFLGKNTKTGRFLSHDFFFKISPCKFVDTGMRNNLTK